MTRLRGDEAFQRHGFGDDCFRRLHVFSNNNGEVVSASAMVSKPYPVSSAGNSSSVRKSMPMRSRMVFWYSTRFIRCSVTAPAGIGILRIELERGRA